MATHSSILAWEIPWTEESVGQQPVQRVALSGTRLGIYAKQRILLKFRMNLVSSNKKPYHSFLPLLFKSTLGMY